MAALTPAQIELASSLAQDELPSKLKCAHCNKLAINAFRLPCCETAICENCQSTLPSSCPVCEHSPVSGDDCTIYKSLRTTIRVFLKTEEKKREAARPKTNGSAPPIPVEPTPTPTPAVTKPDVQLAQGDVAVPPDQSATPEESAEQVPATAAELQTKNDPLQDDSAPNQFARDDHFDEGAAVPHDIEASNQQPETANETADGHDLDLQAAEVEGEGEGEGEGDYDQEPGANGDYNNTGFDGTNMNPMQMQMMMMQNGMNPAAFSGFPMMGMGMGMDPMAMQNMMMNGGFGSQGMGMNGMNMNMGMNDFNGGNNDWNNQQSWQDNFNPNASGMANGDFGNFNSGFNGGYNAGNYGQFNGRGNYQYRGRGRGRGWRGAYGRGGYNPGFQRGYGQQMWSEEIAQHPANNDMSQISEGNPGEAQTGASTDEFGRTIRDDEADIQADGGGAVHGPGGIDKGDGSHESTGQVPTNNASGEAHAESAAATGDVSADPYSRPHGTSYGMGPPAVPSAPLNAPTGPKAMRQGLPNTSTLHLRARGFIQDPQPAITKSPVVDSPVQEETPISRSSSRHSRRTRDEAERQSDRDRDDYDTEDKRSRVHDKDHDRSKSHSKSRSRSRDHKESRRHRRHRSKSGTDDGRDDDNRRHKHKSQRSTRDDGDYKTRSKEGKHDERSRSASPDPDRDHKRSSHRGHRDREKERDRERDSEREHRKKSSHKSRHDDRERDRDRDRDSDRKDRRKERDRDRERDHRHRSSRKTSQEPPTPTEPAAKEFNPPTGPRGSGNSAAAKGSSSRAGFTIKGASANSKPSSSSRRDSEMPSSRRGSHASASAAPKGAPTGPAKDPHTLEREARDRERLLKEAQRMAGLAGVTNLKRGREAGDDRSGRRKNRRSETASSETDEQRMRRLEAEREGDRWN